MSTLGMSGEAGLRAARALAPYPSSRRLRHQGSPRATGGRCGPRSSHSPPPFVARRRSRRPRCSSARLLSNLPLSLSFCGDTDWLPLALGGEIGLRLEGSEDTGLVSFAVGGELFHSGTSYFDTFEHARQGATSAREGCSWFASDPRVAPPRSCSRVARERWTPRQSNGQSRAAITQAHAVPRVARAAERVARNARRDSRRDPGASGGSARARQRLRREPTGEGVAVARDRLAARDGPRAPADARICT